MRMAQGVRAQGLTEYSPWNGNTNVIGMSAGVGHCV